MAPLRGGSLVGIGQVMSSYNFDASDQGPPDTPVHSAGSRPFGLGGLVVCQIGSGSN